MEPFSVWAESHVRDEESIVSAYIARPYEGAADLHALIRFAQQVTRARLPRPSYYHAGDFVWQLYNFDRSDDVRLWTRDPDGATVACAIFEPPLSFQFDISPTVAVQRDLMAEVIRWAERRRALVTDREDVPLAYQALGSDTLSTSAMESDAARIAVLVENGYAREEQQLGFRLARSLDDQLPTDAPPAGARFRNVSDAEADARAELHRDAWSIWGESKHTTEVYRRLRSAPLYDPALDVVLEFEGQLVSYCVLWVDTENRAGLFEPVGTRPSAARRGFGRAVIYEAFRRLREKGMTRAIVGTGSVNKPALALYASAGFEVAERQHTYVKRDVT